MSKSAAISAVWKEAMRSLRKRHRWEVVAKSIKLPGLLPCQRFAMYNFQTTEISSLQGNSSFRGWAHPNWAPSSPQTLSSPGTTSNFWEFLKPVLLTLLLTKEWGLKCTGLRNSTQVVLSRPPKLIFKCQFVFYMFILYMTCVPYWPVWNL